MEFKEILSYTKKWWWLVLLLACGGGLGAYWLYDMLPNQRAVTTWSSKSRFETPRDNLRVIKQGDNVLRVRVDIKSELYAVQSDDNREQAAQYYAVIQEAVESGRFAGSEAASPYESDAYRDFLRDLETLAGEPMSRDVDIYNPRTLHIKAGETQPKRTSFQNEPLLSRLASARDALKRLNVKAETIPQTRVVEISIAGLASSEEARVWADALVLAAIRQSFARHIRSFEQKIDRETKLRDAMQAPLSEATKAELEMAAQERLLTIERLHPRDPDADRSEISVDPIGIPEFKDVTQTNADVRMLHYYKHLHDLIKSQPSGEGSGNSYTRVVAAIENNADWATRYTDELRELGDQRRLLQASKINPKTLAENKYPAEQALFDEEYAKFKAVVALNDAQKLEEYRPNQSVIWNSQIQRIHNEIGSFNRQIKSKLTRLTEDDLSVRALRSEKQIALEEWENVLSDAFIAKETMLKTERELAEAKLAQIETQLVEIEDGIAVARHIYNRLNAIASLYGETLDQINAAQSRMLVDNQKIAGYEANLYEQSAVLSAAAFSQPARPTAVQSNRMSVSVIVGLIILVGSSVMIYVMMLARNKIATEYDVRKHVNLPVLAKMAKRPDAEKSLLTISPRSAAAEAFSTLATQVRSYARELSIRSLLVTSGVKSEGKTDVTCNLAVALARKGLSVLVIDADLHRPRVSSFFGVAASHGLIQFVQEQGEADIIDFVMPTYEGGPDLLLPGGEAQDPVRLLESDAFKSMLKQAEREYDIVLFDSPPVARVGDALIVGAETDATLLVCCAGVVTFADAALAKRLLTNIQANLLGVVLNNATDISAREYYNYYSYGDRTRRRVRKVFD